MESVVLLCMFSGNPRGGRITFFLDRDHGRGERCRWRTASGRDGCPERDFLGMCHGYGWKFRLEFPEQQEMVLLFSVCRNEESRSYELPEPVYPGDDGEGYEGVGRRDRDGYYTQAKNAFTGEITRIKGEDLLRVSPTNLLQALAILTPGLRIVENNEAGSDPNVVPEILIRGASSITTKGQEGVNAPLIMLDGVEISVEDLYDLDIYDIEQILVLKDASAAVLYGEKAANGVILVERVRGKSNKPRFSYNFTPMFSFPDLTSLRLCNAEEKLELERLAGLYDRVDGSLDPAYDYKFGEYPPGCQHGLDDETFAECFHA